MKHIILISVFSLLVSTLHAQNRTSAESAIKKVLEQQEAAWNKDDWEAFSSFYTDDGTLINFVGQLWKGRTDIVTHFKFLSDCCLAPTSLKFEFKNAKFLSSDIAIVYIEETLIADRDYSVPFRTYKKGDTEYKIITCCFVKTDNEWRIAASQVTLINQVISPRSSPTKN